MTRKYHVFSNFRTNLGLLRKNEPIAREPGFILGIPCFVIIRWLVLIGISLRFYVHWDEYLFQHNIIYGIISFLFLAAIYDTYITLFDESDDNYRHLILNIFDVVIITFCYILTRRSQSDFYLFYYLPIFSIGEYYGFRYSIYMLCYTSLSFTFVMLWFGFIVPEAGFDIKKIFVRVFMGREAFFVIMSILYTSLRQIDQNQYSNISRRQSELKSLLEFNVELNKTGVPLKKILTFVTQNVLSMLHAHHVMLYQYFDEREIFDKNPVVAGFFENKANSISILRYHSILCDVVQKDQRLFISDLKDEPRFFTSQNVFAEEYRILFENDIRSCAIVPLKTGDPEQTVGVMWINFQLPTTFTDRIKEIIDSLSSSAAVAIGTARLHRQLTTDLNRREAEMTAFLNVQELVLADPPEVSHVQETIIMEALKLSSASVAAFIIFQPVSNDLLLKFIKGNKSIPQCTTWQIGEGVFGQSANNKKPLLIADINVRKGTETDKLLSPQSQSILSVPWLESNDLLGLFVLESDQVGAFDENDRLLLQKFGTQALIAYHNTEFYKKIEQRKGPLRALSIIKAKIRNIFELDTIFRIIMTGVTASQGLGFSRAMLFLINEKKDCLQGIMAIGSLSYKEATDTWKELNELQDQVNYDDEEFFYHLLDMAERFSYEVKKNPANDFQISQATKAFEIPLTNIDGALSECLSSGEPKIVEKDHGDFFRSYLRNLTEDDWSDGAFAFVPIIETTSDHARGVLVVDNQFMMPERPIDDEEVKILNYFVHVAALSIERATLEAETQAQIHKLEYIKDRTANTVHILNSMVSLLQAPISNLRIKNRFKRITPDQFDSSIASCYNELMRHSSTLLNFTQELRIYSAEYKMEHEIELIDVINDAVKAVNFGARFEVNKDFQPGTYFLLGKGNTDRLKAALIHIIENAKDAMLEAPEISDNTITIYLSYLHSDNEIHAIIKILDGGPDLPTDVDQLKIFEPFETTKKWGTGLGLAIAKDVIEKHNGKITAENIHPHGAMFTIHLPIKPPTDFKK